MPLRASCKIRIRNICPFTVIPGLVLADEQHIALKEDALRFFTLFRGRKRRKELRVSFAEKFWVLHSIL